MKINSKIVLVSCSVLILMVMGCAWGGMPANTPQVSTPPAGDSTGMPTSAAPTLIFPTAAAPQSPSPEVVYQPGASVQTGPYVIQTWTNNNPDYFFFGNALTIAAVGEEPIQHNFILDEQIRLEDVTGDAADDLIVTEYSGGAHCCFTTYVYDFVPKLTQRFASLSSNCRGEFKDLNGDAVPEFLTCDDRWAYRYCAFAASPIPLVVLEYQPGQGYVNASAKYPDQYQERLQRSLALAETAGDNSPDDAEGTSKCAVLALVLDYYSLNDVDSARASFDAYYTYPDAESFWTEIEATMSEPLYP